MTHRITVEGRNEEGDWIPVIYQAECASIHIDVAASVEDGVRSADSDYFVIAAHGPGTPERIEREDT